MKQMIYLVVLLIVLSGCQTTYMTEKSQIEMQQDPSTHIGCQEGEIDENGNCLPATENNAELFGQDLDIYVNSQDMTGDLKGFIATPKESGNYPGIIMIHEWWGLNDNIKEMAKLLAKEGYIVFAVDLYDGEVASDSGKAGELATGVRNNPEQAVQSMKDAVQYLKDNYNVQNIGSIGWCFGGGQSLQLALNEKLDATVIYYGSLVDDKEQLKNIDWPVLGIFGEEDSSIPVSSVNNFKSALDGLGTQNEINIYPGVGHAFANPSGSNYAADETIDAWDKTVKFLESNLKTGTSQPKVEENKKTTGSVTPKEITFVLTGSNYKFTMDGKESPELRVRQGDKVKIEFSSTEGFHDFVVDEFNAATEKVRPGTPTSVEFIADKKGTFEYYCSVGSHRAQGMKGNIIVE